jgi:hypothetical protein
MGSSVVPQGNVILHMTECFENLIFGDLDEI